MNYLAVAIATLVPLTVGSIWFNRNVFGKAMMPESATTEEKKGHPLKVYGLSLLFSIMLAIALNSLATHDAFIKGALYYITNRTMEPAPGTEPAKWLDYYNTTLAASNHTAAHGAFHAFLGGLLIAFPIIATNALFENKRWKYIAANAGYWIVCLTIMGAILAAWK